MKCEVELVATDAVMLKCFPAYAFKPGVKSGYFPSIPNGAGRKLANGSLQRS